MILGEFQADATPLQSAGSRRIRIARAGQAARSQTGTASRTSARRCATRAIVTPNFSMIDPWFWQTLVCRSINSRAMTGHERVPGAKSLRIVDDVRSCCDGRAADIACRASLQRTAARATEGTGSVSRISGIATTKSRRAGAGGASPAPRPSGVLIAATTHIISHMRGRLDRYTIPPAAAGGEVAAADVVAAGAVVAGASARGYEQSGSSVDRAAWRQEGSRAN